MTRYILTLDPGAEVLEVVDAASKACSIDSKIAKNVGEIRELIVKAMPVMLIAGSAFANDPKGGIKICAEFKRSQKFAAVEVALIIDGFEVELLKEAEELGINVIPWPISPDILKFRFKKMLTGEKDNKSRILEETPLAKRPPSGAINKEVIKNLIQDAVSSEHIVKPEIPQIQKAELQFDSPQKTKVFQAPAPSPVVAPLPIPTSAPRVPISEDHIISTKELKNETKVEEKGIRRPPSGTFDKTEMEQLISESVSHRGGVDSKETQTATQTFESPFAKVAKNLPPTDNKSQNIWSESEEKIVLVRTILETILERFKASGLVDLVEREDLPRSIAEMARKVCDDFQRKMGSGSKNINVVTSDDITRDLEKILK